MINLTVNIILVVSCRLDNMGSFSFLVAEFCGDGGGNISEVVVV